MNKAFIISLSVLLGSVALASGCNYATKPMTIHYQKPSETSGDATVTPDDSKTDVAGETPSTSPSASNDTTITPTGGTPDLGSTTPPAPETVPTVETPPSTPPAVAEGDGVADDAPEIGTPPLPAPVSCDEKNFAFVSKRDGASNVYVERHETLTKTTANDTSLRNYANLEVRPDGEGFAADENTLLILIPLVRSAFGSLENPGELTTLPGEGFTRGFTWNHEGTKAAYLRSNPDRGHLSTAIHYVTSLETMETQRDMVVDPDGDYRVGQIAWWGNKLAVDFTISGKSTITVIDPERFPLYIQAVAVVGSEEASLDGPNLKGSQPAVDGSGLMAFVRKRDDGRSAIAACRLEEVPGAYEPSRRCTGLHVFDSPGNNDSPAFSPDGRWIYFVSDRDGNREIYRMHADGTNQERLTNDPAADESPAPLSAGEGCEP